jgi:hypothetical protein
MKHLDRNLSSTKWNRVFVNSSLYQDYLNALNMSDASEKKQSKKLKISHTVYPNGEVKTWKR